MMVQSESPGDDAMAPLPSKVGGGKRWRARDNAEMDMTPMVDVTFLLLIFFMITAAFAMQKSFRVPTPRSDQPSSSPKSLEDFEEDPDYVVVRIDEFNTFHVSTSSWSDEEEAPTVQDLLIQLRRARVSDSTTGGPARMLLVCHGDALHEKVVQAIDAGNEVGMQDIKIVGSEESEL
jgi:biopolymer transport protein ExbD